MTRAVLIHNPTSGGRRGVRSLSALLQVFEDAGRAVDLKATRGPRDAGALTADALREQGGRELDLFVLGGDGTVNEVVAGAHAAGALCGASPSFRLGVLPGGTTNVVALDLALPRAPVDALRALLDGGERRLDMGLVRNGAGAEHPFVLGCGIGLDAAAAAAVSPRLKRWLGRHAYTVAALPLAGERGRPLSVDYETGDGRRVQGARAAWVIVGNTRHYGGPPKLSPRAASDDGLLELLLLSTTRVWPLVRVGWAATRGDAGAAAGVELVQVVRATVRADRPTPYHVDAEPAGVTPLEIVIRPGALRVLVPR